MAYIHKRGKTWHVQISWYDAQKVRQYKNQGGFGTRREAQEWANKMEVAKDDNQISSQDPIFADYLMDWAETYRMPGKSNNTKNRYKTVHKYVENFFGKTKISKMTRHAYQEFMNDYGKDHAKDTVKKTHGTIRACAKDAISDGLIRLNFTDRINLTWNAERTRKIDYLNLEELRTVRDSLLDGIKPSYISRYLLISIMYTGMRPGELRVLTWDDLDFDHYQININKSWDYDNNKIIDYDSNQTDKSTKNSHSVRVIKVDKKFFDIISQLKQNHHNKIFLGDDDSIPTSSAVNKVLRKNLKKCGIDKPSFHFHSLRHSHVAMLLFQGVDLYSISKRLGHANMSITASTYAYMLDELKQRSDNQITKILDDF